MKKIIPLAIYVLQKLRWHGAMMLVSVATLLAPRGSRPPIVAGLRGMYDARMNGQIFRVAPTPGKPDPELDRPLDCHISLTTPPSGVDRLNEFYELIEGKPNDDLCVVFDRCLQIGINTGMFITKHMRKGEPFYVEVDGEMKPVKIIGLEHLWPQEFHAKFEKPLPKPKLSIVHSRDN